MHRGALQHTAMPFAVTEESLKKVSGEFDLPNLRLLDLSGKQIDNDGLGSVARLCPNLVELDLSCNGISDAAPLAGLKQLQKLRLTENAIESLSFAAELPALSQLLIQGNRLGHMREIAHLAGLQNLRTLYLQNIDESSPNPLCGHLSYRSSLFRQLEGLTNLDGQRCHLAEEEEALSAPLAAPAAPPAAEIPAYERWVPRAYWDEALHSPASIAAPQAVVLESTMKDCTKLEASAQVILDRCNGFANVKGAV